MGLPDPTDKTVATVEEMMQKFTGTDITLCAPVAKKERCSRSGRYPKGWQERPTLSLLQPPDRVGSHSRIGSLKTAGELRLNLSPWL
jgi:hypothetical protein